ncbi:MAG: SDR family oxidoreductase [Myxococcota bacterium]|nr:SDR family oxidoreductase [Myxococcota bacterium]
MILENKTVVVCGVGPGLGREVAEKSLRDGARVVLAGRTPEKLEAIAKELDPSGESVACVPTDLTDQAQCNELAASAVERFGSLDALVQVAALDAVFGSLAEAPLEDFQRTFDTNVVGPVRLARAAAPIMKQAGGGSIVLVGSQAMLHPQTPQVAYGASKGGLLSAMYYMATELGPDKIRVNMVVPTWMWGPPVEGYVKMTAKQRGCSEAEVIGEITQAMPLGEIPADDDVAEAIVFFASDRSRMITGQRLLVNAGELM